MQVAVTYEDNGLAKNNKTPAASSTVPHRPRGISDVSRNFFALALIPVTISLPPVATVSSPVGGLVSLVSIHP